MNVFVTMLGIGGNGPLVGIKDTMDVAGVPTRAGSRALDNAPAASANAEVVDRLLAAGYYLVGKTNLHELAFGTTGINCWTGTPLNPKYPDRVPGGSSSGSAVAVANGSVDVALGTDTGGSIRIPAACCGVFGLKPTFGRISRRGVMPAVTSLDCVGPFARDMETLIDVMCVLDPTFSPPPDTIDVRIGIIETSAAPWIRKSVENAVKNSGFSYDNTRLELMNEAYNAAIHVINAETWSAYGALLATGLLGEDVARRLQSASFTTRDDIVAANVVRARFTEKVDELLQDFTILALPTMVDAPPSLKDSSDTSRLITMTSLVRPFNLSGHPAITIPLPNSDECPVSLQLVAAKHDDERLCSVARHIARQFN
ncbi:amidase [Tepidiphilus sp. HLB4]